MTARERMRVNEAFSLSVPGASSLMWEMANKYGKRRNICTESCLRVMNFMSYRKLIVSCDYRNHNFIKFMFQRSKL